MLSSGGFDAILKQLKNKIGSHKLPINVVQDIVTAQVQVQVCFLIYSKCQDDLFDKKLNILDVPEITVRDMPLLNKLLNSSNLALV